MVPKKELNLAEYSLIKTTIYKSDCVEKIMTKGVNDELKKYPEKEGEKIEEKMSSGKMKF